MGPVSGIVVYLMVWWTILFAILPWGNNPTKEPMTGNTVSAPDKPRILKKFLITTGVSAIIWIVIYGLMSSNVISFYDMAAEMAAEDEQTQMNAPTAQPNLPNVETQK